MTYESKLVKQPVPLGLGGKDPGQIVELAAVFNSVLKKLDGVIHHVYARDFLPLMRPNEILRLERTPMNANVDPNRFAVSPLIALHPLREVD